MAKSKSRKQLQIKKLKIKKAKLIKLGFYHEADQVQFQINELQREVKDDQKTIYPRI